MQTFVLLKRNLNCYSPRPHHHQPVQERAGPAPVTSEGGVTCSAIGRTEFRSALGEHGVVAKSRDAGVRQLGLDPYSCILTV